MRAVDGGFAVSQDAAGTLASGGRRFDTRTQSSQSCGESAGVACWDGDDADAHVAFPDMDARAACQGIN